jgi:hypothetical protein
VVSGDDTALARRYQDVGKARHSEGIPLAEVIYKLLLIERKTAEYIQTENSMRSSVDIYAELEMLRALHRFFAIVLHNTVVGYEEAAVTAPATVWARRTAA